MRQTLKNVESKPLQLSFTTHAREACVAHTLERVVVGGVENNGRRVGGAQ